MDDCPDVRVSAQGGDGMVIVSIGRRGVRNGERGADDAPGGEMGEAMSRGDMSVLGSEMHRNHI